MDRRHVGPLEVSAIGLGCMGLSANNGDSVHTDHGIQLIRTAHELAVPFFDIGEAYGPYTNETSSVWHWPRSATRSSSHAVRVRVHPNPATCRTPNRPLAANR
jgi:aryl-alcohol dehydrogenase-like predicted oxidoreductase